MLHHLRAQYFERLEAVGNSRLDAALAVGGSMISETRLTGLPRAR
jgi:hypothetical protein